MNFKRYDCIVEHYPTMWPLLIPGYVPIFNAMLDITWALSDQPKELLDVGCGPGTATVAVAPATHPEGMVTLIDGSQGMLDAAARLLRHHVRCTFLGDFTKPVVMQDACLKSHFDLALSTFALHHISDEHKHQVISTIADSIKPGGLFLLADEIAIDRPGGWDVVERVRGRILDEHLKAGRITKDFWEIETSHDPDFHLPFKPACIEDLTSWMARAGLAVSCPVSILGSALLIGLKPT